MSGFADQVIANAFREYRRLHAAGDSFSAFVSLGEIYNYLSQLNAEQQEAVKWRNAVRELRFSDASIAEAIATARKQVERLARILGVGTRLEYEELMLVIVLRTELDMFCQFLRERAPMLDFDATRADEDIRAVANSRQHGSSFRSAQRAAKRNWKVPIACRWLEESSESLN